ncbi:ABC transporter permease subunit [Bacillus sp. ISL-35]|uniref:ABC transporter permease n=1 Tax=Bacillus sp. ISL-35 TaxID=2819122 RepID=UPI001BE82475|nr:ABC transporter permease [Bacillus sp. ISL-35]MBT2679744.1 ABC transporter permease subunit [Bacillus sp. ISL-35]MBT2704778.1 ABC transporter permease subunit [Chryseobacterium sp. ISL-80]
MMHIARQQMTLLMRSHWLAGFGLLFSSLAVMVAFLGNTGGSGFDGFNRMTASLLNINLLLIPLLSLLIGSLFLSGEKEDRGLMLLLTYPVTPWSVILGKYAGLFVAVWSVLTFGYGTALLVIYFLGAGVSVSLLILFYLYSLLLAAIFLSLAMVIGIIAKSRFQALGISLIVWAFLVLFYEFIIMGLSLLLLKQWLLPMLTVSIFLNPVELIRVQSILSLDGASVFGPRLYDLTIWADGMTGKMLFIFAVLLWMVLPVIFSVRRLKRGAADE